MGIFENIPSFLHEELFFFSYHDWPIYNKIFCMKKYYFGQDDPFDELINELIKDGIIEDFS